MKYSKATNYALHTMLYLVSTAPEQLISVHQLAEFQKVSPTYLSKILTKLVKAGMIESTSGANGGYRLSRKNPDPSFWKSFMPSKARLPCLNARRIIMQRV